MMLSSLNSSAFGVAFIDDVDRNGSGQRIGFTTIGGGASANAARGKSTQALPRTQSILLLARHHVGA